LQDVANNSRLSLTTGYRGALEYIFVVESEADPAAPVIRELIATEAEKTGASERSKSGADLRLVVAGRGLHSSTSQLNLSRVCHKKTPYTPKIPPNTPLTRATQSLRAPPIPYEALKLS
jgi:hypothetical protein